MSSVTMGPFYCTADRELYLDTDFFNAMDDGPFGADAAQAYVVFHEVAHHVQVLTGVEAQASAYEAGNPGSNRASLLVELQADCLAGVLFGYADRKRGIMEPGDREEVIAAARSLGENYPGGDELGVIVDAFTHGSADQRERWLLRGWDSGDPARCDTFAAATL